MESGLLLPSTGMAAHAVDDEIEIELEDNVDAVETTTTRVGVTYESKSLQLPLPPPPPILKNNYSQVGQYIDVLLTQFIVSALLDAPSFFPLKTLIFSA